MGGKVASSSTAKLVEAMENHSQSDTELSVAALWHCETSRSPSLKWLDRSKGGFKQLRRVQIDPFNKRPRLSVRCSRRNELRPKPSQALPGAARSAPCISLSHVCAQSVGLSPALAAGMFSFWTWW